jgi:Lipoprotein LpqB beta-propeller domain
VNYQIIGTLNDYGQVVPAPTVTGGLIHFFVRRSQERSSQLRIDGMEGAPPGLLIAADALDNTYYRQQPIYFWDTANQTLVPDLRYVPLTVPPLQRANAIMVWLIHGPSQLISGGVNTLPALTAMPAGVTIPPENDSLLTVKLSPQAAGKGPADIQRLYWQLQASLLPGTNLQLQLFIGATEVHAPRGPGYQGQDLSSGLPPVQKYDIVDGVVKPAITDLNGMSANLSVLTAKENSHVLFAAITRNSDIAAYVRASGGAASLVIARAGAPSRAATRLPHTTDVGHARPAWIPGTDALLIAWAGHLYLVDSNGFASQVPTSGLGTVTGVSVAPDGRRVALVAGGEVYVAQLTLTAAGVSLGTPQQIVVDPHLDPSAVAWESEVRVYVVGTAGAAGKLWLVTIDGAVATNKESTLKGTVPTDVIAYPQGAFSGAGEALLQNSDGWYRYGDVQISQDGTKNPFFVI